jgi:dUTPase
MAFSGNLSARDKLSFTLFIVTNRKETKSTVDTDNDGNIGICLQNNSDEIVSFKKGERIMQGIFVKYAVCDSDDTNEVRKGGFGSTGKE